MTLDDVLALARAGFSNSQIVSMAGTVQAPAPAPQPVPAPVPAPQPAPAPVPQYIYPTPTQPTPQYPTPMPAPEPSPTPAPYSDPILDQLKMLTSAVQTNNLQSTNLPYQAPLSVEDRADLALASIIDPPPINNGGKK